MPTTVMSDRTEERSSGDRRKTLVFHIGDHKTGSTSIQYALAANRVQLKDRSLFYPAKLNHNMLRPHFEAYSKAEDSEARAKAIQVFRSLGNQLRKSDADYCVISAEGFELVDPSIFRDVLETYWSTGDEDIRIIGYVRPHAARLLSDFAERTKIGGPKVMEGDLSTSVEVMSREGRLPYLPRFSAWREQFGDRFILRPMIRDQLLNGDVVQDFIDQSCDGNSFEITGSAQANESLDLTDLMRLKVLQQHCIGKPAKLRHTLGWEFARVVGQMPPPAQRSKLALHRDLAQRVHQMYISDARAMDQEFFNGTPFLEAELDKALATAVETPQSVDPEDHLSEAELRGLSILSEIMADMFRNTTGAWPEFFQSKRIKTMRRAGKATESKK